jgi:multidrug efflux pump subunit AcrA (membrane-fusion protein)
MTSYLAHKLAQVQAINVADKATVKVGSVILTLDTINEDLKLARLAALDDLRSILALRLDTPVLTINRRIAQLAVDAATSLAAGTSALLKDQQDQIHLAGNSLSGVNCAQTESQAIAAPFQKTQAELQQKQLELQIAESLGINDLVKDHLQTEIAGAQALKQRSTFVALSDGVIRLHVFKGAFVKKGQLLFEVN